MIKIPAVRERCAGIDVGKRGLAVAVLVGPTDKEPEIKTGWFGTTVPALESLRNWLTAEGCSSVAMESTGPDWIPVKNVLEVSMDILLVCPKKHHPKKGDKTDFRDAINLCHHHRHGLLTGSYLPERGIVERRDLTRRRKKLLTHLNSEKNRVQKVLEMANVKIGNVISDIFGVSGQQILEALIKGRDLPAEEVAGMAHQRLRKKIPELVEALQDHHMTEHHRWLIQQSIDHIVFLDRQLEEIDEKIQEKLNPYRREFELLLTIPGMKDVSASSILAEIGPTMKQFETSERLCKWAGITPGNNRSAGKSKSTHLQKANKFLLTALVQAAWAATRKRDSIFQRRFHRWVSKLGYKKASVAIGHSLLKVIFAILRDGRPYQEPDPNVLQQLERQKLVHHHARRLRQLGADPDEVQQMIEQMLALTGPDVESPAEECLPMDAPEAQADAESEESDDAAGRPNNKGRPAAPSRKRGLLCRGALGFRTRAKRNEYSIVTDLPDRQPLQADPKPLRTPNIETQT